ncbi:hypothetical protein [Spirochaeta cellobiosiphila]|uniref:hypothetical protein n=1 Tax=Spirochaeta cellobiosiphila TaxID=504483 RepID=UPI000409FC9D|nr:hypothetical protein [Spirochaeta cellobiosiphila]
MENKKPFIITIDTEGDNQWARKKTITTENTKYIPRFQELCNKYGFKPVYLCNYEITQDKIFVDYLKSLVQKGEAEVGMHLHAWHSPPKYELTEDDYKYHPYLVEYPFNIRKAKLAYLYDILTDLFETKIISHRAGRWAMDDTYFQDLYELGLKVDCSVTPGIDWSGKKGAPNGFGGTDYHQYPNKEYIWNDKVLEVPMTIINRENVIFNFLNRIPILKKITNRYYPQKLWFRSTTKNIKQLLKVHKIIKKKDYSYLMYMLHSSEFMPNGSPNFKDDLEVDKLYSDLDLLFSKISESFYGCTLKEYYEINKRIQN